MCFLSIAVLLEGDIEGFKYALGLLDRDAKLEVEQMSIYIISLVRFLKSVDLTRTESYKFMAPGFRCLHYNSDLLLPQHRPSSV